MSDLVSEIAALKTIVEHLERLAYCRPRPYFSPRGFQLVYVGAPPAMSTITCENYCKWYDLFVVTPTGAVESFDHGRLEGVAVTTGEAPYVDHAPNPTVVMRLAKLLDYVVCPQSYEMMIGRWELEHTDHNKYSLEG